MKRKKQNSHSGNTLERFARLPAERKRRLLLKSAVGLGILGIGAGAISDYDSRQRELHDLTSVGAGEPVVVQVHDTSCPICRSLKSITTKVIADHPHIRFRIADIATGEGQALQRQYGVQKTTLLLFDGRGNLLDTVVGAQSRENLERLFARHYPPAA
ncbi:thioredoxin family protein [Granulosicoccus sp. 3-233]|uniref:thioredoxin family protein n=1 Tax=Granulosicoccus sp. 3-233 TaxID=3417969 RepID=UPI003D328E8C